MSVCTKILHISDPWRSDEAKLKTVCCEAMVVKETQNVDGRAGGLKSRRMGGGDHMTSGYCSRYIGNTLVQQFKHEIDLALNAQKHNHMYLICTQT